LTATFNPILTISSLKMGVQPRLVIHGGAGNIIRTAENLDDDTIKAYRQSLYDILATVYPKLRDGATALDAACEAVRLFEDNPLFNAGKGAAFTRTGHNELEASVMVSKGYRKRSIGVMRLTTVKNPVLLAKEMLIQGEADDGGGAQTHCLLSGEEAEALAERWGLETVDRSYFWTQLRWDEHRDGLARENHGKGFASWDPSNYVSQGTTGCVALDSYGTICAATSTGGMTNKVPGRVGDTPVIGAGFWAEEWQQKVPQSLPSIFSHTDYVLKLSTQFLQDCIPLRLDTLFSKKVEYISIKQEPTRRTRAVGISGTGSGDTFVRLAAVRTTAAAARFHGPTMSLRRAMNEMAGPDGEIQLSAGSHWGTTGEGEAGMIGIELVDQIGAISISFNTPGMFRGLVTIDGEYNIGIFADDDCFG
jgi:L-asparaginase